MQAYLDLCANHACALSLSRLTIKASNNAITRTHAAHQDALKREIERLRQVYHQQNIKKTDSTAGSPSQSPSPKPRCDTLTEKEQLINVWSLNPLFMTHSLTPLCRMWSNQPPSVGSLHDLWFFLIL